jgi:thymidylate synthase
MEEIISQYGLKVKDDSSPVKVDSDLIKTIISKLKNNKKAGKNVS